MRARWLVGLTTERPGPSSSGAVVSLSRCAPAGFVQPEMAMACASVCCDLRSPATPPERRGKAVPRRGVERASFTRGSD